jgi:hypothetical protein
MATYQILKLAVGFPMVNQLSIPLDPDDLREVESTAEDRNFRFPIAFAPNLQSISILHTVYWIGASGALQQQRLSKPLGKEIPIRPFSGHDDPLQRRSIRKPLMEKWKRPGFSFSIHRIGERRKRILEKLSEAVSKTQTSAEPSQVEPSHANYATKETSRLKSEASPRYYKIIFSPCGQFVARLERQQDMNESALGRWDITLWKRHGADPSAMPAKEQGWKENSKLLDIYSDFTRGGTFTFNPQFQQIGLFEHTTDSPTEISVWNFGTSTKCKPL